MLTVIKSPFELFPEYLPCIENTVRSGLRKKGKSIQKWKERCVSNFTLSKRTRKNLSIIPSSRDLSKKKKEKTYFIFPLFYTSNNNRFQPSPFTFRQNIFHRSQRNFQRKRKFHSRSRRDKIQANWSTRRGPWKASLSLSLSRKAGGHSKKRERERSCALPSRTRLFVICQGVCLRSLSWRSRYPIIAMAACFLGRGEGKNRGRLVYSTPRERERGEWEERREQRRENERRKLVAC